MNDPNDPNIINEFSGSYRFLSNFWSCYISYEGVDYPSVENAYQAAKCAALADRVRFQHITASEAKKLGRLIQMRPDWNDVRVQIMTDLVRQKFSDPSLAAKLLETGDIELQEGNWWGDVFWGTVNGVGQNVLGNILMKVRKELRDERGS